MHRKPPRRSPFALLLAMVALAVAGADRPAIGSPPAAAAARIIEVSKLELVEVATGQRETLQALAGPRATIVFFSSNECPVALAYEQELAAIAASLAERGVKLVAVSSSYADTRDAINRHRLSARLPYPLYRDVNGRLADALGATRTSEVALLGPD